MAVVITHRPQHVIHNSVRAIRVCATVLDLKCAPAAAASIKAVTRIVHVRVRVVKMDIQRRTARMHIEAQRHRAVLHFTVGGHIRKPKMVARSLYLHSIAVEPVNLQMLNFHPRDAVHIQHALPAEHDGRNYGVMCRRIAACAVHIQNEIRRVVPEIPILTKRRLAHQRRPPNRPKPYILQRGWWLRKAIEAPNAALHHIRKSTRGGIQRRRPDVRASHLGPPPRRDWQIAC